MNISKYTKRGKNMIIELHNGVEYLVDNVAEEGLKAGVDEVTLIRLYDREIYIALPHLKSKSHFWMKE